jgi:hypothetical protein
MQQELNMSDYIRIHRGKYGNRILSGVDFPLVRAPTLGATKGWFVSVDGTDLQGFPQRPIHVLLSQRNHASIFRYENGQKIFIDPIPSEKELSSLRSDSDFTSDKIVKISNPDSNSNSNSDEVKFPVESEQDISFRIQERFEILSQMAVGCAAGSIRSLVVTGAPGMGKSYEVIKALQEVDTERQLEFLMDSAPDESNLESEEDNSTDKTCYVVTKGFMNANALYALLYHNRGSRKVLIFDDCDSALLDETALQLLKAALDTNERREISWGTSDRKDGLPSRFVYEGSIIFITNINFEKLVSEGKSRLTPHLAAILDRSLYLDLLIHSMQEKMVRINYVSQDLGMLTELGLDDVAQNEVLDWVYTNARYFRDLSLRKVLQVASIRKMGDNWRKIATVTLLRGVRA